MMQANAEIDYLLDLLERERMAILDADFGRLERLLPEKERILQAVHAATNRATGLARARAALDRNNRLLQAAALGLRNVRDRLSEHMKTATTLRTYDRTGQHQTFTVAPGTVERKA